MRRATRRRFVAPAVSEIAEHEVVGDGRVEHEPFGVAIFVHDRENGRRVARRPDERHAVDHHAPADARLETGERAHQLSLPVAFDARDADDFARRARRRRFRERGLARDGRERQTLDHRAPAAHPEAIAGRVNTGGGSPPMIARVSSSSSARDRHRLQSARSPTTRPPRMTVTRAA